MTFLKAFVVALLFAIPALWAEAQMRAPVTLTSAQFAGAPPGQPVKLVVRLDSVRGSTLEAEILARRSESAYAPSGAHVELTYGADVPIVMGAASDIEPGAVLFVDAVASSAGRARAKRFVVVTRYVSVTQAKG